MLDKPEVAELLRRDFAQRPNCASRVLREYPFACRVKQTLISGVIDRLVLWSEADRIVAAELLDFKTDAVAESGAALEAQIAEYRPQLETYRQAVAQLFGLELSCIAARLIFLQPGLVVSA